MALSNGENIPSVGLVVAPVATDDSATINEDSTGRIAVLSNDSDADGDTLRIVGAGAAANGTATVDGTAIVYEPNPNFSGVDTFTYTITDDTDGEATATVNVTVTPINDAPVPVEDAAVTDEDVPVTIPVLANDTDADGDVLTISNNGQGSLGSVAVLDGQIVYTPNENANGVDTFRYEVSDPAGRRVTSEATVTINPVNDVPVALPDEATLSEDGSEILAVLNNDTDVDGDALAVSTISVLPTLGVATIVDNGGTTAISYTPNPDANGVDTLTYVIDDGNGGTSSAVVTINITPVNDAPIGVADGGVTGEDVPLTIDVLANDTDIDGDILSIGGVGPATNGTTQVTESGILYTPNANFNGTDSFVYRVTDPNNGQTDIVPVTVTVEAINDLPVVAPETGTTNEDEPAVFDVLANDSDVDGDPLTVSAIVVAPVNGTAAIVDIEGRNALSYTPNQDYNGPDSITYTVADPNGGVVETTLAIEVQPVNDAPIAIEDVVTTEEDTAIEVLALVNDIDIDGDELRIRETSEPANGEILNITTDGRIIYRPNGDFNGVDSFTYVIGDGSTEATGTVNVTVNPVNDAPIAVNDEFPEAQEDTPITIAPAANDTDIDGDPLVVSQILVAPTSGLATVNPDGTVTYTPNANFNGTDSMTYEVFDGLGGVGSGTAQIRVNPVNDAPFAEDDFATTTEDRGVRVTVRANDTDIDGDTVSVNDVITVAPQFGTATKNANGTIDYLPNANFNGVDSFTYTANDGNGGEDTAVVTVTVDPVNDAPVTVEDVATTDEDTPITINALANDTDIDGDVLTIVNNGQGENGTVEVIDNQLLYTPNANFNGIDSFVYQAGDGNGGTTTGNVTVTVNPINDVPVATPETVTIREDEPGTFTVLVNDTDPENDTLAISSLSVAPVNGVATIVDSAGQPAIQYTPNANFNGQDVINYVIDDGNGGTAETTLTVVVESVNDAPVTVIDDVITDEDTPITVNALLNDYDVDGDILSINNNGQGENGTVTVVDNQLVYTPNANFNGFDSFVYQASDGLGGLAFGTVNVTVNPTNDAPTVTNETARVNEDEPTLLQVLANDSDIDGDVLSIAQIVSGPTNGVAEIVTDLAGQPAIQYTTNLNYNGPDELTYLVDDGNGGQSTGILSLEISNTNDLPTAVADVGTTDEDSPTEIFVLANDFDIDGDSLRIREASDPVNGEILNITDDNRIIYRPDPNFNGVDTFTYSIGDGQSEATGTVEVIVNPVNDNPVAVNEDFPEALEDTPFTIAAAANDLDIDGDPLVVSQILEAPTNGTALVNPDGTITYTPNPNFNGTDRLQYEVSDGQGGTGFGTIRMRLNPVNDAPVAEDDFATTPEDRGVRVPARANDTDVDGDIVSVDPILVSLPTNGSATVNTNGTIDYLPNPGFSGIDSFVYRAFDGNGGEDTATVTVTVDPVNDAPVLPETIDNHTDEDTPLTVDVVGAATDEDSTILTIIEIGENNNGTVTNNGDGTVTFTPNPNFTGGSGGVTVTIADDLGATAETLLRIRVDPVNDAPIAVDDEITTEAGRGVRVFVRENDSDVDSDVFGVVNVSQPLNGTATIANNGGVVDYQPREGFSGPDSFTYEVSDFEGGFASATVNVNVLPDPSAGFEVDEFDII